MGQRNRNGEVAVITGAASGIGLGIAKAFASAGMKLVLSDIEASKLEAAAAGLIAEGASVKSVLTNVSDACAVDALASEAYATFGRVDVVCNNAGVIENFKPTWDYSLADWDWVLGINLMGVGHGVRSFVPRMIEDDVDGHIVNTASIGGLVSGTANGIYTVSKHAVVALSEVLQNDLNKKRARLGVSVLCPGLIATEIALSDRNRDDAPELSDREDRLRQSFNAGIANGMEPREVGRIVLAGIDNRDFYIKTHPELDDIVRDRFEGILDGRRPAATRIPLD